MLFTWNSCRHHQCGRSPHGHSLHLCIHIRIHLLHFWMVWCWFGFSFPFHSWSMLGYMKMYAWIQFIALVYRILDSIAYYELTQNQQQQKQYIEPVTYFVPILKFMYSTCWCKEMCALLLMCLCLRWQHSTMYRCYIFRKL